MQGRCDKHLFDAAEDRCGKCGYEFCSECLVYSFGPKKPPYCISCAVAAAGIRSTAGVRPMVNARQLKALRKERRAARGQPRDGAELQHAFDEFASPEQDFGSASVLPSPVLPSNY